MAHVTLERPDLSLYTDPVGTRVELPYVTDRTVGDGYNVATAFFDGDYLPSGIRAHQRKATVGLTVVWPRAEQAGLVAMLDLLTQAGLANDARLQLRLSGTTIDGLTPASVVLISEWAQTRTYGQNSVSMTATQVGA